MNLYPEEVICSACGGEGVARPPHAEQAWLGVEFAHRNLAVCRDRLARQRRELEAKQKKMEVNS